MPIERWRSCLSITLLVTLAVPTGGCANSLSKRSARPQPVGMGLLEFLGSADPTTSDEKHFDGASWMDYLSELNMGKAAKTTTEHATPSKSTPSHKTAAEPHTSGVRSR